MAARPTRRSKTVSRKSEDWLFPKMATATEVELQPSLLDVVDNVLNKGMLLNGDLILGVANVDLIYAKLSVLLAAIDRVTHDPVFRAIPAPANRRKKRAGRRRPRRR